MKTQARLPFVWAVCRLAPDGVIRCANFRPTLLLAVICFTGIARAALIDVWRAEDLTLNDGDIVGTWGSASNRNMNATLGDRPTFFKNVTPAGTAAVRFNRHFMTGSSAVGGRNAFSIAVVFKASAAGAGDNVQWYGKSGIVDAEQGGVMADWGTVLDQNGQVGIGTGSGDLSTYSTGASLVDNSYHVAVFTWGGGSQSVYVDLRAPVTAGGASTAARNNANMAFGGILTGEGGTNRRLVGDLVEIRFYDTAFTSLQASNVIQELRDTHIVGNVPRIRSFAATTNQIYLGASATLGWDVTNAPSIIIDQGIGAVAAIGTRLVSPTNTTTYTLTATNVNGVRTASVTVVVDPGIPIASSISTNTPRNTALALTLRGNDPQGSNLVYSVVNAPSHGTLSGTPPNVTYTPSNNYDGLDAFTFKVNDGVFDSAPATVSIKVIPPPTAPSAIALSSTNIPSSAGPGSFIAGLRAIDINEDDTHTFLLVPGSGNNNQFVLTGNTLTAGPTFVGGIGATFTVRLRVTDNTSRSTEQTFALRVVDVPQTIVINEIHYNAEQNVSAEEFIELHNPGSAPVDVSLWRLSGGVDFVLPPNTSIPARGFLVVAEHPPTVQARYGVSAFGPWQGGLNNEGEEITLRDPANDVVDRVDFRSEFPWPVRANGDGASMQLVNSTLDNDLGSSWRSGTPPTPGTTNIVFATNAAPNIRQVDHSPNTPSSTNQVVITAKVTDPEGVASVTLAYQIVLPGQFIPSTLPLTTAQLNSLNTNPTLTNSPNPAFEAPTNWITVTMHDDGLNGDEIAGDSIYSVILPQQAHRTLVRYRITCADALGVSRRAPFEDDPSLNFAYFVYDGIPPYQGISSAALQTLPIYQLITRDADMNQCAAWFNTADQLPQTTSGRNEGRLFFNWEGAIVYDGEVYDHITYRLRGANGRYHPGKRSFRFRFKQGHYLEAKDQYGDRFPTKWRELTTGKGQSNRGGEQFALNEVVNFFLWNKVGVPAPRTFHFHFRVIRGASEQGADPYSGDFWGLNWGQEKYDVNFLDSHDMPKGNLYKLVDNFVLGVDERRYQAPFAVTNAQDFFNIENNLTGFQSNEWLIAHANYTNWYRYFTIAEAIRHYDTWPSANKNGAWYFEPPYAASNSFFGRMMQLPYDGTDTWGATWNNGEDILFNGIFPSSAAGGDQGQHPELQLEYRNVVREIRSLLFQPDQINAIIDAFATPLLPVAQADFARWAAAPAPASYSSLLIPNSPGAVGGLPAYAQDMKNFMFVGGNNPWWIDRQSIGAGGWVTRLDTIAAADTAVPSRPTISYVGSNDFSVDGLIFQSSDFADPQGGTTFGAVQWRVAEVLPAGTVITNTKQLRLEWDAAWDSGEIAGFNSFISVPASLLAPERLYRARVRHKDNTGRWSSWSLPFEFRPRASDLTRFLGGNLVFNEIMYNPPADGTIDGDEFEYLELKNVGTNTLDLTGLSFSSGITFSFTNGTRLAPGQLFLLARNPARLAIRYPGVIVNGVYTGRLDNGGETLAISHPQAGVILSITYSDRAPWPITADGFGWSLVLGDPATGTYRASAQQLGSPGTENAPTGLGGVVINEVVSSSTPPLRDSIELLNTRTTNMNIGGWYLTDDPSFPWKYRIADGTTIPAGGYLTFDETQFNPTPGLGVSFSLSSFGDEVYLFSASTNSQLTGYTHGFSFDAAQDGVSFGRYINSVGEEQFPLQISRSPSAPNAGPRVGPVVISEIHYHPRATTNEFLELQNVTSSSVALYDPANRTNTWLINGLAYSFPTNITIPANGYLVLVNDDPAAFRARFDVPTSVGILRYTGGLQDSGENLGLQSPDIPTSNGVPYFAVDTVRYNDRKPWPRGADGAGASLQRINTSAYGNDPTNWLAAVPTPGGAIIGGTPPAIAQQPISRTNAVSATASFTGQASGTGPVFYQWRFNGSNLPDATNATLVLPNVQLASAGTYSVVAFNAAGSVESSNATLVVRVGVTITNQPTTVNLRLPATGTTNATFSVGAVSFNPPLRYQWQFNGADIPGATNAQFTITNVQFSNEGAYSVVLTDTIGAVPSAPAQLNILVNPLFTSGPANFSVVTGAVVSLSATATGNPLPFAWEWRRLSTALASNAVNQRFSFLNFVNTNDPGSTVQYRVIVRTLAGVAQIIFNITTLADTDGDGIPDEWETAFGGNLNSAADRNLDPDLDGLTNWQEYTAGTDPTNRLSTLKLNLTTAAGDVTLAFDAASNRTYSVQFTDRLGGGSWSNLADFFSRTNSRMETVIDRPQTTNRFYRIVTPRQP